MKFRCGRTASVFVGFMFLGSSAFAQATRTWVSGVGNDADPCSRTAPCKTFANAISKTTDGGEISVIDAGGYGPVVITKPITISGIGTQSSILAPSGGAGIVVNFISAPAAPQTATVALRNIQINGTGVGANGVIVVSAVPTQVILDNVNIYGFGSNAVLAEGLSKVMISGGMLSNNTGIAIHALETSSISVENAQLVGNNIAVQADMGSTIRLSNNGVYDNKAGFACGTMGTLATANNNRKANNVGGVVMICNPNGIVTVQ